MKNYINFHTNYKLITSSSYRHLYSFAVKYPTQRFKTPITFPGARKEFGGALLKQNVIFHGQLQIKTSPANSFNSSCVWQCWLNETPHPEQGKLILHIIAVALDVWDWDAMPLPLASYRVEQQIASFKVSWNTWCWRVREIILSYFWRKNCPMH